MGKFSLLPVLLLVFLSFNTSLLAAPVRGTDGTAGALPLVRSITAVSRSADTVEVYDRLDLTIGVDADFDNPYDPDQIRVDARFESPSGEQVIVPGFWYQHHLLSGTTPRPTPDWSWQVRFTPTEPGTWRYQAVVTTGGSTSLESEWDEFEAVESDNRGFIRIDSRNPRYFQFDSGDPYFAVGENMGWSTGNVLTDYSTWLSELSGAGGNFIRVWMASWSFGIEWQDTGLGSYDQRQNRAFQLDQVFELARENNVYIMLSLLNHGAWNRATNPEWDQNPYNSAVGGMLDEPHEFATNPEAIRLWRQRLRYIVARWGYSPNLMAWEWWNEINWTSLVNPEILTPWMEMSAEYLLELDPNDHLITHSGSPIGSSTIWGMNTINFTQQHLYNLDDLLRSYNREIPSWLEAYPDKPFLMGEFGTDSSGAASSDTEGMGLHLGLWAAPMNGASGTAMTWWWDSYVHPLGLTTRFTPVAKFFGSEDMGAHNWQLAEAVSSSIRDARVYGLKTDDRALLWVVNRDYSEAGLQRIIIRNLRQNVENPYEVEFEAITGITVTLQGLSDGDYTVELWDPQTGDILSTEPVTISDSTMALALPPFQRDLAIKVKPNS